MALAMLDESTARLQQLVDDPIKVVTGDQAQAAETLDLTIPFWLLLGTNLSWPQGVVAEGEGGNAVMQITLQFHKAWVQSLAPSEPAPATYP